MMAHGQPKIRKEKVMTFDKLHPAVRGLTGFFLWQHTLEKATLDVIAGPRE